jgi:hypothetical protein
MSTPSLIFILDLPFETVVVADGSHDDEGAAPDIRYQRSPRALRLTTSSGSQQGQTTPAA